MQNTNAQCNQSTRSILQEGDICSCKLDFAMGNPKYTNCRVKCFGDEETVCGGKGYASIYRSMEFICISLKRGQMIVFIQQPVLRPFTHT